jgi:hypothetical protein
MLRSLPLLAALAAVALPLAAQEAAQEAAQPIAIEPSSGVIFPMNVTTPGGGADHYLAGMGIRTKTFLKVKVYAFGLYVDREAAEAGLSDWKGDMWNDLQKDDSFYAALLAMDFPITLRLVMTRNVGGDDMAEAFDGALRPRVQAVAAEMPGGEAALDQFRTYFNVEEMTDESELVFSCAGGTLSTSVKGEVMADIESPALCWALFDVYLGEDPISKDGKKNVVQNFPNILAGR